MFAQSRMIHTLLLTIAATLVNAALGLAQLETAGGITATGTAKSNGRAELMRLSISIEAKGSDLAAAMTTLKEKQKKATIKLEKMEAIEDSIKFGEISTGGQSDTSSMMQQMKRQFGNDPRMAKMMKVKPPVTLTVTLTADWKLDAVEENAQLLLACDKLKQKISDQDIGGTKDEQSLSEEQEELAEEMAEMMSQYGGGEEVTAGTPNFYYVRKISPESQTKLIGEAFQSAKSQAQQLAKATNFKLGKIKTLSTTSREASVYESYYGYGGYGSRSTTPTGKKLDDGTFEAVSQSPGDVSYEIAVSTAFEIDQ